MAYVGTPIDTTNQFQSLVGKRFSGNASTTAFTLDVAPSSTLDIEVFVENVRQDPNSAYSLSGTTLTFAAAPPSGTNNIYVVHQAPTVASVSPKAGSVTASSFDNSVISGHTALAATPADTDEFLVSDAGTIKRIDFSHIKGLVRQVVQTTKTDIFSSTSTSFADVTGVTANITPSSTSSKILVMLNGSANSSQASTQLYRLKLLRGSTSIGLSGQVFESYGVSNAPQSFTTILLDEPSSTSEQTYKLQVLVSGDTVYIGGYGNAVEAPTTLTLMEILA